MRNAGERSTKSIESFQWEPVAYWLFNPPWAPHFSGIFSTEIRHRLAKTFTRFPIIDWAITQRIPDDRKRQAYKTDHTCACARNKTIYKLSLFDIWFRCDRIFMTTGKLRHRFNILRELVFKWRHFSFPGSGTFASIPERNVLRLFLFEVFSVAPKSFRINSMMAARVFAIRSLSSHGLSFGSRGHIVIVQALRLDKILFGAVWSPLSYCPLRLQKNLCVGSPLRFRYVLVIFTYLYLTN